jgi:hypothetical protein
VNLKIGSHFSQDELRIAIDIRHVQSRLNNSGGILHRENICTFGSTGKNDESKTMQNGYVYCQPLARIMLHRTGSGNYSRHSVDNIDAANSSEQ